MRLICNEMMATDDITECMFTVGSVVSCLTCFDVKLEGEVIAFDYNKRLLVLKSDSSDGNEFHNDINCLNLEFVKDVVIKKEVKREDVVNTQLPQISTSKVEDRCRRAGDERKRLVDAFNAGASTDGIKLWLQLNKTHRDVGVSWDADNIIVDNSVRITPPYKVDNCSALKSRANSTQDSLKYTKKLVEKFWNDQKNASSATPATTTAPVVKSTANSVQPTDKPPFNNKG